MSWPDPPDEPSRREFRYERSGPGGSSQTAGRVRRWGVAALAASAVVLGFVAWAAEEGIDELRGISFEAAGDVEVLQADPSLFDEFADATSPEDAARLVRALDVEDVRPLALLHSLQGVADPVQEAELLEFAARDPANLQNADEALREAASLAVTSPAVFAAIRDGRDLVMLGPGPDPLGEHPRPSTTYVVDSRYHVVTDAQGRIVRAMAALDPVSDEPPLSAMFSGPREFAASLSDVRRVAPDDVQALEDMWRQDLEQDPTTDLQIDLEVLYGTDGRPSNLVVTETVDEVPGQTVQLPEGAPLPDGGAGDDESSGIDDDASPDPLDALVDALEGGDPGAEPIEPVGLERDADGVPVAAFGEDVVFDDGIVLRLSEPRPWGRPPAAAGGDPALPTIRLEVTVTNDGDEAHAVFGTTILPDGDDPFRGVFLAADGLEGAPTSPLQPGETVTWEEAFSVDDLDEVVLLAAPGFDHVDVAFTGSADR